MTCVTAALANDHPEKNSVHETLSASRTITGTYLIFSGGFGPMILCVDDEQRGLMVRKMLLELQGHEVLTALSGHEGLDLFVANPIEAVVLDYSMPGMNGDQVAAEMKRLKPEVKILLLSAFVDLPADALRYVDKRAVKGVSPTAFITELEQLLAS